MIKESFFTRYSKPLIFTTITAGLIVGAVFLGELFAVMALMAGAAALMFTIMQAQTDAWDAERHYETILDKEARIYRNAIDDACDKVHEKQLSLDDWQETKTSAVKRLIEKIKEPLADFKFYQIIYSIFSAPLFFFLPKQSKTDVPLNGEIQIRHETPALEIKISKAVDSQPGNSVTLEQIEDYVTKKETHKRLSSQRRNIFFGGNVSIIEEHNAGVAKEEAFNQLCRTP